MSAKAEPRAEQDTTVAEPLQKIRTLIDYTEEEIADHALDCERRLTEVRHQQEQLLEERRRIASNVDGDEAKLLELGAAIRNLREEEVQLEPYVGELKRRLEQLRKPLFQQEVTDAAAALLRNAHSEMRQACDLVDVKVEELAQAVDALEKLGADQELAGNRAVPGWLAQQRVIEDRAAELDGTYQWTRPTFNWPVQPDMSPTARTLETLALRLRSAPSLQVLDWEPPHRRPH